MNHATARNQIHALKNAVYILNGTPTLDDIVAARVELARAERVDCPAFLREGLAQWIDHLRAVLARETRPTLAR